MGRGQPRNFSGSDASPPSQPKSIIRVCTSSLLRRKVSIKAETRSMEWMMHGTARAIKVPLPGLRTSRPSSTRRCRALRMVERPTWKKRVSSASVGMRSPGLIPMRWARNRSAACSYRERTLSRSRLSMGGSWRSVLFIFHHPHTIEDIYFLIARGRAPVKPG